MAIRIPPSPSLPTKLIFPPVQRAVQPSSPQAPLDPWKGIGMQQTTPQPPRQDLSQPYAFRPHSADGQVPTSAARPAPGSTLTADETTLVRTLHRQLQDPGNVARVLATPDGQVPPGLRGPRAAELAAAKKHAQAGCPTCSAWVLGRLMSQSGRVRNQRAAQQQPGQGRSAGTSTYRAWR